MSELLFSYGTLQLERVQLETFGRKLIGVKETLKGFKMEQLEITDALVLQKSQQNFHPIAVISNSSQDEIQGTLFEISEEELKQADSYEVADYQRIQVKFESGSIGWIYIKA